MNENEYGKLNGRLLVELNDPEWELIPWEEVQEKRYKADWPPVALGWEQTLDGELWSIANTWSGVLAYRRKRQPQPASSWISVKERLPQAGDYPMWITDGKVIGESTGCYIGEPYRPLSAGTIWDYSITHFCPKPKQEPPPLPQGESEDGFYNWYVKTWPIQIQPHLPSGHREACECAWTAALQQKATK